MARPRELHAEVGEVDLALVGDGVEQVVGRDLEGAPQQRAVAHEEAAALVRLVEPLVRIERDRVCELDPGERLAAALGQRREAAVGGVDVQPRAALAADLGDLGSGSIAPVLVLPPLDGDEERPAAGGPVGFDRRGERAGLEP